MLQPRCSQHESVAADESDQRSITVSLVLASTELKHSKRSINFFHRTGSNAYSSGKVNLAAIRLA